MLLYVGTEFSATKERLETALKKAVEFRVDKIKSAAEKGQTFLGIKTKPVVEMDLKKAYRLLEVTKKKDFFRLEKIATEKATNWMLGKRPYMTFRNKRFKSRINKVGNKTLKIPNFIWLEDGSFYFEYELPNNTLYYDDIEINENPELDIQIAVAHCFLESMLTNKILTPK